MWRIATKKKEAWKAFAFQTCLEKAIPKLYSQKYSTLYS